MPFYDTQEGHSVYYEQWGSPSGNNVVFLHGGPGYGCQPGDFEFFDPAKHHVLFHDQRGSGKSTPIGNLEHNNTYALLQDVIHLMDHVSMDKAHIFGGSWGSALAVILAIHYPERVKSLVLRGFFPANNAVLDDMTSPWAQLHFENRFNDFISSVPSHYHNRVIDFYHEQIAYGSTQEAQKMAQKWHTWGAVLGNIDSPQGYSDRNHALLTTYYAVNRFFIEDDYIFKRAGEITVPVYLVHGIYDFLCPVKYAIKLQQVLPNAMVELVTAGHSSRDPQIRTRLIRHMSNLGA